MIGRGWAAEGKGELQEWRRRSKLSTRGREDHRVPKEGPAGWRVREVLLYIASTAPRAYLRAVDYVLGKHTSSLLCTNDLLARGLVSYDTRKKDAGTSAKEHRHCRETRRRQAPGIKQCINRFQIY
jgi:hypothetical protein